MSSITVGCPSCERTLRVPEHLIGTLVRCPACSETFTAREDNRREEPAVDPPNDYSKDRISSRQGSPPEEMDWEPPPSRKSPRVTYEDEDEDYRPARTRRRGSRGLKPHRGDTIMMMGILSFFVAQPILGIIAWFMGHADLKEIRSGVMDPEGESQTRTGMICGMISTIIYAGSIVLGISLFGFCCLLGNL